MQHGDKFKWMCDVTFCTDWFWSCCSVFLLHQLRRSGTELMLTSPDTEPMTKRLTEFTLLFFKEEISYSKDDKMKRLTCGFQSRKRTARWYENKLIQVLYVLYDPQLKMIQLLRHSRRERWTKTCKQISAFGWDSPSIFCLDWWSLNAGMSKILLSLITFSNQQKTA